MSRDLPKRTERTKTQHYVPQFYLRGFTNASGQLRCYDKVTEKSHPTSTSAAAQEAYFYEIPPGSFKDVNVPLNTVEHALAVVEKTWAPLHGALIKSADSGRISASLTIEYAPFLVTQWMRTRTYRDAIRDIAQKSLQSIVDDLTLLNFPGERPPMATVGEMAALHSQKIFDHKDVVRMARELERHIWVVGINECGRFFYTSDHPVVRRGNGIKDGRRLVGVSDPGIEFAFPLDSTHLLLILERTHFAPWRKHDNRALVLSEEQVDDYNALQVLRSCQRVFCADDDFNLARQVCAAHPEVRDPNRPRVRIESTPVLPAGRGEDGKEQFKSYMFLTALE